MNSGAAGVLLRVSMEMSDRDITEKYRESGNMENIGMLYDRYAHLMLGMCITYLHDKDEAKDAMEQIWEKLIKELKKQPIDNFKSWLGLVSRNHCISLLRKKKSENNRQKDYGYLTKSDVESQDELRLDEEPLAIDKLPGAIEQLNESQQTCIRLFYLEEKSYAQIQSITGFGFKEVKTHLQNGKRNLRKILEHAHIPK
jgi:RNA polymerase sigma-70 factor, ECF subfamily